MQELTKFIYEIDSLTGIILSIIIALIGISISILLVFWWQAAQTIFGYIQFLIQEGKYYKKEKDEDKFVQIRNLAVNQLAHLFRLQFWSRFFGWGIKIIFIIALSIPIFLFLLKIFYYGQNSLEVMLDIVSLFLKGELVYLSNFEYYQAFFGLMIITTLVSISILVLLFAVMFLYRVSRILPGYIDILEKTFDIQKNKIKQDKRRRFMFKLSPAQGIYIGSMGAIAFVLAFLMGSAVNALTGIPLTGGILNGVIVGAVITIGIKGVDKFGAATLIWFVFTVLAIPTITFGPPGWYKVIVGIIVGFAWDLVISLFKRNKAGYIIAAGFGASVITWGIFIAAKMLGLPAAESLQKALYFLIPMNFVISSIGAIVGLWLFNKYLKDMRFIQNLRS